MHYYYDHSLAAGSELSRHKHPRAVWLADSCLCGAQCHPHHPSSTSPSARLGQQRPPLETLNPEGLGHSRRPNNTYTQLSEPQSGLSRLPTQAAALETADPTDGGVLSTSLAEGFGPGLPTVGAFCREGASLLAQICVWVLSGVMCVPGGGRPSGQGLSSLCQRGHPAPPV